MVRFGSLIDVDARRRGPGWRAPGRSPRRRRGCSAARSARGRGSPLPGGLSQTPGSRSRWSGTSARRGRRPRGSCPSAPSGRCPSALAVGDRVVVRERLDPALVELLAVDVHGADAEREAVLAAGEVVDELVVVPVRVVGGRAARLRPRLHRQVGLVRLPLLLHGQGDVGERVAGHLGVGVDRVAHQHVEVVALLADRVPDLEVVPVGRRLARRRAARPDRRRTRSGSSRLDFAVRRGGELAGGGVRAAVHAEAVAVGRVRVELLDRFWTVLSLPRFAFSPQRRRASVGVAARRTRPGR